jgi:putative SOS response-associated peptidase YedK
VVPVATRPGFDAGAKAKGLLYPQGLFCPEHGGSPAVTLRIFAMCGRLTLDATPQELVEHFGIDPPPALAPRFNIAPSQLVAAVGLKPDGVRRGLILVKWGLVPDWANDAKPGPINARAETIASKPTFRDSFLHRRCLIPAPGFYEWAAEGGKKLPHFIHKKGGGLLGLAGLWSLWKGDGKPLLTCCVVTTTANELVRPLHDRMPVILRPEDYGAWLDGDTDADELQGLLRAYPAEEMESWRVGPRVNSAKVDEPGLADPLQAA